MKRLQAVASEIEKLNLEFKLKGGEKGEVFGSVTKAEIKKSLGEKGFTDLEVLLTHPLKTSGEQEVEVNLGEGIRAKLKLLLLIS